MSLAPVSDQSVPGPRALDLDAHAWPFVPVLELVEERVLREDPAVLGAFEEISTATARLSFEYAGHRVRGDFELDSDPELEERRDPVAEDQARRVLEAYGLLEIDACSELGAALDGSVDYVVDMEGDPDALCSFSASVVPALRERGFVVIVAQDYPCQLVEPEAWVADVSADEKMGWFDVEFGIEVGGEKVDLLPVLLDMLESGRSLDRLGMKTKYTALPLGGRRFLAVSPDRVRALCKVVRELYDLEGSVGSLRVPALVPSYFDELEAAMPEVSWRGDQSAKESARALSAFSIPEPVEAPKRLRARLRPYQADGVAWLQNLARNDAGGILADDMGLGKTLQTIAHLCIEHQEGRLDLPALVVAPTSLVGNWRRELRRFAPHLLPLVVHGRKRRRLLPKMGQAHVVITTYPVLVRDAEAFGEQPFHLLVLDEAQAIKNSRSQAHAAVSGLDARLRLCLTGTPIENNLGELHSLFAFLMPSLLGDAASFRQRYGIPIEQMGNTERLGALRKRVTPFLLRRLKSLVAHDLPPKTEIVRAVELGGDQRDVYESIRVAAHDTVRGAIKKKGLAGSTIDILGALMKLRQLCCHPRLVPVAQAQALERSAKLDLLMEMVPTLLAEGRRILIFSQFTSMLALIAESLRASRIEYLSLTGKSGDRQALVDRYEAREVDVFLISLKAGGVGLNLTSADTVIHFDPWWNPAAQDQATDRAHRLGQTRNVFVYKLIVAGSVEERMLELQRRKRALADGILAGSVDSAKLTAGDVDGLFDPIADA